MRTKDFLGNAWEYDCLGCAVARAEVAVPGGVIRRSAGFCVHQDPLIPLPGFLVIASTRHIRSLDALTDLEYAEFAGLVRQVHAAIKQAVQVDYLSIIQEEHASHFHLWFFPWLPEVIQKFGEPSLGKIRQIMAESSRHPIGTEQWHLLEKTIRLVATYISKLPAKERI
jgi:diadenosine tetraphosphate (Ap4A) HIT family hydrolase